jgi:hypothetical protein
MRLKNMKFYLLRVCAFKKDFENLCDAYRHRSLIFYSLREAVKTGKAILKFQTGELFKTSGAKAFYKRPGDEFIEAHIDYIFEIEEFDPDAQKNWRPCGRPYEEIENPYAVIWEFDYKGKLTGRWFGGKPQDFDAVKADYCPAYDYRPGDEKADAGTRFRLGDVVCSKDKKNKRICVVGGTPLKEGKYFENNYICEFIGGGNLTHYHPHESEIEKYAGEIPEGLLWLSRYFKGEIKISPADAEKISNGEYSFRDEPSYKTIKTEG